MKYKILCILLTTLITSGICLAQTNQPAAVAVEDFKPASTNQPGREYPQVVRDYCQIRISRVVKRTKDTKYPTAKSTVLLGSPFPAILTATARNPMRCNSHLCLLFLLSFPLENLSDLFRFLSCAAYFHLRKNRV